MGGHAFRLLIALALAALPAIALDELVSGNSTREIVPIEIPYDAVGNYSYPNLLIPPLPQPAPDVGVDMQQRLEWLRWWQEFDGGGEGDGGGGNGGQGDPKVFVVWMFSPPEPNIYWKDKTYDVYSGWNWSASGNGSYSTAHGNESVQFKVLRVLNGGNYSIQLIKPSTPGSFIDTKSFAVENGSANYSVGMDPNADYLLDINATPGATLSYNATFYGAGFVNRSLVGNASDIPPAIRGLNTQLPENIDPELRELAKNLTLPNATLLEQAEWDRDFVHAWVEYDLFWADNQTIPVGAEMANWTYRNRKGICAHYASLYAVIARLQGIPTRIATGFAGGYPAGNASYIFPIFGHAWAESYIPPYGWLPLDPTGNVTDRGGQGGSGGEGERRNASIEWSDAGKVTLDLQFTLNRTLDERLDSSRSR
jgi:transglutaminase-like putative cysteine protease